MTGNGIGKLAIVVLAFALSAQGALGQQITYVDGNATGLNTGDSWANAFTDLQSALAGTGGEVWVAVGRYTPAAPGGARSATFQLNTGHALYGGFVGGELTRDARDPVANVTTLSGDLLGDDPVGAVWTNMSDNSYHVVTANGATGVVLDGFTITRGRAESASGGNSYGGGLSIISSSISITNSTVKENIASWSAGMYNYDSPTVITACKFLGNYSYSGRGGAIYHDTSTGSPVTFLTIKDSQFIANRADVSAGPGDAGAIWSDFNAPLDIDNCLFERNIARWRFINGSSAAGGGAILIFGDGTTIRNSVFRSNTAHIGGALWIGRDTTVSNCLFIDNEAVRQSVGIYDYGGYAGAVYCTSKSSTTFTGCTFHANKARNVGGIWASPTTTIVNSILWSNISTEVDATLLDQQLSGSPIIEYSCVKGLFTAAPGEQAPDPNNYPGSVAVDPIFFDLDGADNILGNHDDDLRLGSGSPCIDAGNNNAVPALVTAGLDGNLRFFDDPNTVDAGVGIAPIVDMGAYEFGPWVDYGGNAFPTASFVVSQDLASVSLEDTSTDTDGTIVEWVWDLGDGMSSTFQNPQHTYAQNGNYEITLTVRDSGGATHRSAPQLVSVTSYAAFTLSITSPIAGATVSNYVTLKAQSTNDPIVEQVKFYDNGDFIAKSKVAPFEIIWNTNLVAEGAHTITAKANDFSEVEIKAPPIMITVDNLTPFITSAPFDTTANVGSTFTHQLVANGVPAPTFSITSGPIGMTVDSVSGLISFVPTLDQLHYSYVVNVRATNTLGSGEQVSMVTVNDTSPPSIPTGTAVVNLTTSTATLVWDVATDNVGVVGYELWRYRKINRFPGRWVRTNTLVPGTSTVVSGGYSRYGHKYAVKSIDSSGNVSGRSATMSFRFATAPTLTHFPVDEVFAVQATTLGSFQITVSGNPVPTVDLITPPAGMDIDATGLITWTPDESQVGTGSVTVYGSSSAGTVQLVVNYDVLPGPDVTPPSSTPTPTVTFVTHIGCDLSWMAATDDTGVTGYLIQGLKDGVGQTLFTIADVPAPATTFTIATLDPNTGYDLWVTAYDAAGNIAPIGAIVGARLVTASSPVTPPVATTTGSVSVVEGGAAVSADVATVSDQADTSGSLLVSVQSAPVGLSVSVANNAGTATATATASCGLLTGTHTVTLLVTDSDAQTTTTDFSVIVGANPSPTIGAYTSVVLPAVESTTVSPFTAPADGNGNLSSVVVAPTTLPNAGTITIDSVTGVVAIDTTIATIPGDYNVTVTVTDACGASAVESFILSVAPCTAPPAAITPLPVDLTTEVDFTPTLSWDGGVAFAGCPRIFDVYMDTVNPPTTLVGMNLTSPQFTTASLVDATTYYWQVVSTDCCSSTASAVWSFTTRGIPAITSDVASIDYTLAPDTLSSTQVTLTNVGTGATNWLAVDIPASAAAAAVTSGNTKTLVSDPLVSKTNVIDWDQPHVADTLIVSFKTSTTPARTAIRIGTGRFSSSKRAQFGTSKTLTLAQRNELHLTNGTTCVYSCKTIPVDIVRVALGTDLRAMAAQYAAMPEVDFVEPNYLWHVDATPNDPSYGQLWGMNNSGQLGGTIDTDIDAPEAWNVTTGSRNIIVGVIDTGVDYTHPDLAPNMWTNDLELNGVTGVDDDGNGIIDDIYGARWTSRNGTVTSGDPYDDHFHGTHVSGTIGGAGNNGIGVVGVSWNVRIMALKFLDASGGGVTSDAIAAIEYAVAKGAHLTSNSWGGGAASLALQNAIDAAGAAGQLFIAAAGNSNRNTDFSPAYPASYNSPTILSVASIDRFNQRSSFSNYGLVSVDLGAPGTDVYSCAPGGIYRTLSGTSMATPHVSGVAALVLSRNPTLTALELKQRLMDTVEPMAALSSITVTGGRVNAFNAVAGLPWITITPSSGNLQPGESVIITVTADTSGLPEGYFENGFVSVISDAPTGPYDIPISLSVGIGPLCSLDSECDDGLICNGFEACINSFCRSGTPVNCDDAVACTTDTCLEPTGGCLNVVDAAACDNGLYCDGLETCDSLLGCVAGVTVDCDDGVACTVDSCNEVTNACDNLVNDVACDNGLFCDGYEACDAILGCVVGADPCPGQPCDEARGVCSGCAIDADCDDGVFCNGAEFCDGTGACQNGTLVDCNDGVGCTADVCDEAAEACVSTPNDLLCDDGIVCNGVEICDTTLDCVFGAPVDCSGLSDPCNTGVCDEALAYCVVQVDPDGQACDNGDSCPGDTCQAGFCEPIACSPTGPAPPTGLVGEFSDAAKLAWIPIEDDTIPTVNLYVSDVSGGPYTLVDSLKATEDNFDYEAAEGVHCFVLTAVDTANAESVYSNEVCGTIIY